MNIEILAWLFYHDQNSEVSSDERGGEILKICLFTFGGGGGGGGGYTVGADILSSADWYHHSIIYIGSQR